MRFPSDRLLAFSIADEPNRDGRDSSDLDFGGVVDRLYRLIRSSELPVARMRLSESDGGDRARQRIEEVCAAKRKVSVKSTSWSSEPFTSDSEVELDVDFSNVEGIFAAKPCSTRSYEPVTICTHIESLLVGWRSSLVV